MPFYRTRRLVHNASSLTALMYFVEAHKAQSSFPAWGTWEGQKRTLRGIFFSPSCPPCFFLSARLTLSPHVSSAALFGTSLSVAAVRHPCMHWEGVLTGHAGYFNVGGLHRLDIPGQGVSCVRTSLPGDTVVQRCDCAAVCSHVARTRVLQEHTAVQAGMTHMSHLWWWWW